MTDIKTNTVIEKTTKHSLELNGKKIAEFLRAQYPDIPKDATISFHVPGGGDWSHMDIDIDDENPVYVEWKQTSVETESR